MSNFRVLAFSTVAVAGLALAAPSAKAATTLNLSSSELCAPGGCFGDNKRTFTHSFAARELGSGSGFNISSLRLSKDLLGEFANYGVKISFETADGTVVADWGKFTLAVLAGDVVTIGGQAFDWSAMSGDLVIKLESLKPQKNGWGAGGGFGGSFGGGGFAAAPMPAPEFAGGPAPVGPIPSVIAPPSGGLVTDLRAAVPEPATWAMMILGFGAAGAVLRRQRFAYRYG